MAKSATLNFEKTLKQLKSYLSTPVQDDRDRAGIIQAFEFTYEQAWKAIQKTAGLEGVTVASPKQAFVFAMQAGWISVSDEPLWLKMMEDRNLTTHTYKEELALAVLGRIQSNHVSLLEGILNKLNTANKV